MHLDRIQRLFVHLKDFVDGFLNLFVLFDSSLFDQLLVGLRKKMRFGEVYLFCLWMAKVIVWLWTTIAARLALETILLVGLLKLEGDFQQAHLQRCQQGVLETFR